MRKRTRYPLEAEGKGEQGRDARVGVEA